MKSIKSDMHVHTRFSCDSQATMESYCERAVESGVGTVCFTEHVDFNPNDCGYGFYDAEAFFEEFYRARDTYAGRVRLLCGVEFSEPHEYPAEFEKFRKMPFDFIIGSVHYWYGGMFPSEMVKAGVPIETCYETYWDEVLKAVSRGGFDCLGHMDFPKRYYGKLVYDAALVKEICETMVRRGICPEVNTSSLRKGLAETMPGAELLNVYREAGGRFATIGSDAHRPEELAAGHDQAKRLIEEIGLAEAVLAGSKT
jgi:histidinol-phosphatase (PHP family)